MKPAESDDTSPGPERDPDNLPDYFRAKADECLLFAERAADPKARNEWVQLANSWTNLALQTRPRR